MQDLFTLQRNARGELELLPTGLQPHALRRLDPGRPRARARLLRQHGVCTGWRFCQSVMTSRLVALCFDANDPLRLARFWAEALRWEIDDETA